MDRSTAQQLAITVGNVTVIITDFKEKTRSSSTSSTITSSAGSEQQHQSSGSESMDKGSSRASTPKGDLSVGHDESFWAPSFFFFFCLTPFPPSASPPPSSSAHISWHYGSHGGKTKESSPFPIAAPAHHPMISPWMLSRASWQDERQCVAPPLFLFFFVGGGQTPPTRSLPLTVASKHLYVLFYICSWMWGQVDFFIIIFVCSVFL